jgi:endonuclease IV
MIIGTHINSSKTDILNSAQSAYNNGANIIQFMVISSIKDLSVYDELRKIIKKNKMHSVVHISYTINCSQMWDQYSLWIKQLMIWMYYVLAGA